MVTKTKSIVTKCYAYELHKAVQLVSQTYVKNAAHPVATCAFIDMTKNSLSISTTNMEVMSEYTLQCESNSTGQTSFCVSAELFVKLIKSISEMEEVELIVNLDDTNLVIKTKHEEYNIKHGEYIDKPEWNTGELVYSVNMKKDNLINILNKVSFSAAQENTRFTLATLCIEIKDKSMFFVSADGKRMSVLEEKLEKEIKEQYQILVHKNISNIISSLNDEELKMEFYDNALCIRADNAFLHFQAINGNFAPWRKVAEADIVGKPFKVYKSDFLSAVKKSLLVTDKDAPSVDILFDKTNSITVVSENKFTGNKFQMKIDTEGGYDIEEDSISLNPKLLFDLFKVLDDNIVELYVTQSENPVVYKKNKYLHIIMPLVKS